MIVRHIVEISEDDVMTYHFYYLSRATTLNSANTKLVTLARAYARNGAVGSGISIDRAVWVRST